MFETNAEIQRNAERIAHMKRIQERLAATKPPDTGLIYGVPARWLRRSHELNAADQQRLIQAVT
jgi:hypothetical protein